MEDSSRVVFYDGDCALCDGFVRFLLRIDKKGVFHFAPLQGPTAGELREKVPSMPSEVDTVVFYDQGRLHLRSKAVFRVLRLCPWPWKFLAGLAIIPTFLADAAYNIVAAHRHKLQRKRAEVCPVIPQPLRSRFLP